MWLQRCARELAGAGKRALHRHSWHYSAVGLRRTPTGPRECRLGAPPPQSKVLENLKHMRKLKLRGSKYQEDSAWEQSLYGTVGDLRPGETLTDEEMEEASSYSFHGAVTPRERHWHMRSHHYPYHYDSRR